MSNEIFHNIFWRTCIINIVFFYFRNKYYNNAKWNQRYYLNEDIFYKYFLNLKSQDIFEDFDLIFVLIQIKVK